MRRAVGETRRTINKIQQPRRCALSWGDMLILTCTALGPPSLSWITCNLYFCTPPPCRWEKLHHQMRFIFPPSSPSARLKLVCLWWQEASGLHQIRELWNLISYSCIASFTLVRQTQLWTMRLYVCKYSNSCFHSKYFRSRSKKRWFSCRILAVLREEHEANIEEYCHDSTWQYDGWKWFQCTGGMCLCLRVFT